MGTGHASPAFAASYQIERVTDTDIELEGAAACGVFAHFPLMGMGAGGFVAPAATSIVRRRSGTENLPRIGRTGDAVAQDLDDARRLLDQRRIAGRKLPFLQIEV